MWRNAKVGVVVGQRHIPCMAIPVNRFVAVVSEKWFLTIELREKDGCRHRTKEVQVSEEVYGRTHIGDAFGE